MRCANEGFDVKVDWSYEINLFYGLGPTRTGSHRGVFRVRFSSTTLPELPGENHRYDVASVSPECHAQADFFRAAGDRVAHDSVQADTG